MQFLMALLFLSLPLDELGVYIGGKLIMPGVVVAGIIAIACLGRLLEGRYRTIGVREHWPFWFAAFMIVGLVSTLLSPYAVLALPRGVTQIVGIAIMMLMCAAFLNEIRDAPRLFPRYVKLCVLIFGVFAISAVAQSFVENVLQRPELVDLDFINNYTGSNGDLVWRSPDSMGPLMRASSLAAEPAHFVVILGTATGPALLRLGLLGKEYQNAIARVIPAWAAVAILLGFLVALSLIGYFLLAAIAVSLWLVSHRFGWKMVAGAAFSGIVMLGLVYVVVASSVPELIEKLATVVVVVSPETRFDYVQASAVDLALNVSVMEHNVAARPLLGVGLGAHPVTYEELNPGVGRLPFGELRKELNKEDANSLLVRLLSESGIAGTMLYIGGLLLIVMRARSAILDCIAARAGATGTRLDSVVLALAIGMTASLIGLGITFLARQGVYYSLQLWIPLALVTCVPVLLSRQNSNLGNIRQ